MFEVLPLVRDNLDDVLVVFETLNHRYCFSKFQDRERCMLVFSPFARQWDKLGLSGKNCNGQHNSGLLAARFLKKYFDPIWTKVQRATDEHQLRVSELLHSLKIPTEILLESLDPKAAQEVYGIVFEAAMALDTIKKDIRGRKQRGCESSESFAKRNLCYTEEKIVVDLLNGAVKERKPNESALTLYNKIMKQFQLVIRACERDE